MIDDHDEALRAALTARPDPAEHPDEETWVRLASAEIPEGERQALLDHVVRCGECARIYQGLRMLATEARSFDATVPAFEPPPRVVTEPRWLAAGALGAVAAAVVFLLVRPPISPDAVAPAHLPSSDLRSDGVSAPVPLRPLGQLAHRPGTFDWRPMPEARAYNVRLLDAQGEVVWTSPEVVEPSTELPAAVPLARGRHYWQVLAHPASGGEPIASKVVDFEL
jgi:hypothetical protein